jgi:hypothetical protein
MEVRKRDGCHDRSIDDLPLHIAGKRERKVDRERLQPGNK